VVAALGTEDNINSAWETVIENIKISAKESVGYYEMKKHEPWFDKGCQIAVVTGSRQENIGFSMEKGII
jgi:hypothetical protein